MYIHEEIYSTEKPVDKLRLNAFRNVEFGCADLACNGIYMILEGMMYMNDKFSWPIKIDSI